MPRQDDAVKAMGIQYACDCCAHRVARKGWRSDAHRNGQNLDGDDADVWVLRGKLAEERDVG